MGRVRVISPPPKEKDNDNAAAINRLRFAIAQGDIAAATAALTPFSDVEAIAGLELAARNGQDAILKTLLGHINVVASHAKVAQKTIHSKSPTNSRTP